MQAINSLLYNTSFCDLDSDIEVKIVHSRVDADDYRRVITENIDIKEIVLPSECKKGEKPSSGILQCYKFFYNNLSQEQAQKIYSFLTNVNSQILVAIELSADENEQAIFDTINSAGVRLSSSDIIKNALFQKAEELETNQKQKATVIQHYEKYWQKTFLDTEDIIEYWGMEKKIGRYKKDNLELLLYCVAINEGFYNPYINKTTEMVKVYREYTKEFDSNELYSFIIRIALYAEKYKILSPIKDVSYHYSYENDIVRLLHILEVANLSTIHPYILKLFMDNDIKSCNDALSSDLKKTFNLIEAYVMRHIVCGVNNSNFNKVCYMLVTGRTISEQIAEESQDINDDVVRKSLQTISRDEYAKLVLFWIELWLRKKNKRDIQDLTYTYQLEHLLPQKWEEYWNIDVYQVKDPYTNFDVMDNVEAKQKRSSAVYELGNMTLLNGGLNATISNFYISDKISPSGKKRGLKDSADLDLTKEVLDLYEDKGVWNEFVVRGRTNLLADIFVKIWSIVSE